MIKTRNGEVVVTNKTQNSLLKVLYGTIPGRLLLKVLTLPVISKAAGAFMDSSLSTPLIDRFIKSSGIDVSQYNMYRFRSYNDFFTRTIKEGCRPIDMDANHLISPCDSKLTAYRISDDSLFLIKDSLYSVSDLLKSPSLAEKYRQGWCLIFRLEVDDYHRYCYIDNGQKSKNFFIKGELHTVNPIALEHCNIYKRNSREFTVMKTENFGRVIQVEVGAMMVGRICNHQNQGSFRRGDEKGMFQFGGSTIVMLFEKDSIALDGDILKNSLEGCETIVKYGEKIGTAARGEHI